VKRAVRRFTLVASLSVPLLSATSRRASAEDHPTASTPTPAVAAVRPSARVLLGVGRADLAIGAASGQTRAPLVLALGGRLRRNVALGGDLALDAGRSDAGIWFPRLAPGVFVELTPIERLAVGVGVHTGLYGFARRSGAGAADPSPSSVVLRPVVGAHTSLLVDVVRFDRSAVVIGARGDLDLEPARYLSGVFVAGVRFD